MGIKDGTYEAPDIYDDINDFIREYSCDKNDEFETNQGIDFTYNGKIYHLCRYPMEDEELKRKFSKITGKDLFKCEYEVAIIDSTLPQGKLSFGEVHYIGWYSDIYDLLENCEIEGKKFKDLLLNHEIVVTGKDRIWI